VKSYRATGECMLIHDGSTRRDKGFVDLLSDRLAMLEGV
jgi:hypothetical protein